MCEIDKCGEIVGADLKLEAGAVFRKGGCRLWGVKGFRLSAGMCVIPVGAGNFYLKRREGSYRDSRCLAGVQRLFSQVIWFKRSHSVSRRWTIDI